jgi:hypothetical protein
MKPVRSALLLMVCLALAGNVPAQARPASYSGTSKSMKSGFSSQKNNSAVHSRPAPPPANRQSGPGAFGQAAGSPAQPQRNSSALSRDVDQSAARANALRTLDERRAAAHAPQPLPPLNDTLRQPARPGYQPPPYPAPAPAYQQPASSGNAWMAGALGFMLGRAMHQGNQPVAYPTTQGQPPQPVAAGSSAAEPAGTVSGMPGLAAPAPQPERSLLGSVLRWLAWLSVLSLFVWVAVYAVRKLRRLRSAPNYSFERN